MGPPFIIREFEPSDALRPFIRRWLYFEYTSDQEYTHKVAPSGTIYLNHAYDCEQPAVVKGDKVMDTHTLAPCSSVILSEVMFK